jgi:hypothetical protein
VILRLKSRAVLRAVLAVLALVGTAGCAGGQLALLTQENGTDLDPVETDRLRRAEDVVVYALAEMSGFPICPPADVAVAAPPGCAPLTSLHGSEWGQILLTGLRVADRECERYLGALFWFDRAQRRAVDQIGLGAAAAAAIVGLTGGSAETIAIMTSALGLIGATVQNVGSGLLYDIGPSAVYEIVEANQTAYKAAVVADLGAYDTRPAAMWAIQNYAAICLPPAVETEIRRAVKNARPEALVFSGGVPPTVGQGVTAIRVTDAPEDRQTAGALLTFAAASAANRDRYLAAAAAAGLDTIIPGQPPDQVAAILITRPENAARNADIARELGLAR